MNLKYLEWSHRAYIKTAKNDDICQELLGGNDLGAILATFCGYGDVLRPLRQFKRNIANAPYVL